MRRICKVLTFGICVAAFNKFSVLNDNNNELISKSLKIMQDSEDKLVKNYVIEIV